MVVVVPFPAVTFRSQLNEWEEFRVEAEPAGVVDGSRIRHSLPPLTLTWLRTYRVIKPVRIESGVVVLKLLQLTRIQTGTGPLLILPILPIPLVSSVTLSWIRIRIIRWQEWIRMRTCQHYSIPQIWPSHGKLRSLSSYPSYSVKFNYYQWDTIGKDLWA